MTPEAGEAVNGVAKRICILTNQLSAGRREAKQGKLVLSASEVEAPVFAPLVLCEVAEEESHPEAASQAIPIRIIRGAVVIDLAHDIPADRL